MTTPVADGWTPHDGGECPLEPGVVIDVRYGDGEEEEGLTLHEGHGSWAYGPEGVHETDVIAYRVVDVPALTDGEGSYADAFYEIAAMLDIPARAKSPAEVWRDEMKPRLRALLNGADR